MCANQSNCVRMIGLYVLIVKVLNGTRQDKCQIKSDFIYCWQIPISRRISDLNLTVIHKYDRYFLFISLTEHSNVVVITPVSDGWTPRSKLLTPDTIRLWIVTYSPNWNVTVVSHNILSACTALLLYRNHFIDVCCHLPNLCRVTLEFMSHRSREYF
jgi:hypothetical protein